MDGRVLAVAVHLAFVVFLIFSVNWQNREPEPVSAELYAPPARSGAGDRNRRSAEPEPPKPAPEPPKPPPEPPKPPPEPPKPVAESRAAAADQGGDRAEGKAGASSARKSRRERERKEKERIDAEKKKAEEKRLAEVRERQAREADALKAQAAARAGRAAAHAARRGEEPRANADYIRRIQAKVKGNVIVPPEIAGNPEAIFDVVQLPTGEIIDAQLRKSSGNRAYDEAVQRAIIKSSPLPRPDSPDLFQRNLTLKFRPLD